MKKYVISLFCVAAMVFPAMSFAAGLAADTIQVSNAYMRAVPPGATNTAIFADLKNTDTVDHQLIAVVCPLSRQTQLHMTTQGNTAGEYSMMRMRQVNEVTLPAGKTFSFHPGGYHIMVMDLTQSIKVGQQVPAWLIFADGSHKEIVVTVKNS